MGFLIQIAQLVIIQTAVPSYGRMFPQRSQGWHTSMMLRNQQIEAQVGK